ncbi:cysteine hydrolase family protein [Ramlibacter sp. MMS24-I3-19]|uniref:cysteine hydrolase family protein n=1 Tax=Ramlibacter sp. MMS24-I3-19 TaxID=3416606 RepID=UPI003CFE7D67
MDAAGLARRLRSPARQLPSQPDTVTTPADPMKSALLVIDVQRALFDAGPRPFEADAVVGRINVLAARARRSAAPVIFVQHETPASALELGSSGWRLANGVDAQPGDHSVRKATADSFQGSTLKEILDTFRISHVVVCGYASEFCVDTTVRRAAALGYAVTLASDAHTTHDKAHASAASIRVHENATLPEITSFGPVIRAVASDDIAFGN